MDFNTNLDWLSKEFVLEVISKDTKLDKRDLFVKKYYTKPATKTGENFSSYMHRLYVNFTCPGNNEINKTFIVKVLLPKDSDVGIIHNDLQLFKKEVQMYDKNITIVNEMLGNYYPGFKLSPE